MENKSTNKYMQDNYSNNKVNGQRKIGIHQSSNFSTSLGESINTVNKIILFILYLKFCYSFLQLHNIKHFISFMNSYSSIFLIII